MVLVLVLVLASALALAMRFERACRIEAVTVWMNRDWRQARWGLAQLPYASGKLPQTTASNPAPCSLLPPSTTI